jgi:hypothetical protein
MPTIPPQDEDPNVFRAPAQRYPIAADLPFVGVEISFEEGQLARTKAISGHARVVEQPALYIRSSQPLCGQLPRVLRSEEEIAVAFHADVVVTCRRNRTGQVLE